jgi:hypothetical protein
MMTQTTLSLLGYLVASAYVVLPALLLLLCSALARALEVCPVDHDNGAEALLADRDRDSAEAIAWLKVQRTASSRGNMVRAEYAAAMARYHRNCAIRAHELALILSQ